MALQKLGDKALKKKWIDKPIDVGAARTSFRAPVEKVGKLIASALKPGRKLVSVVRFHDGKMEEVTESTFAVSGEVREPTPYRTSERVNGAATAAATAAAVAKATRDAESAAALASLPANAAATPKPAVATTVAAPTRGCPAPVFDPAEIRARAVLSAFLTEPQRQDFDRYNRFVTVGGASGHHYMVTSRYALRPPYVRSLYDIDERRPICTHDFSVPPAEEMLTLHLLASLPQYEPYLRTRTL